MTKRTVVHDTIVVERLFDAAPERVFGAWADPEKRARWDVPGEGWVSHEFRSDFRVGGREVTRFGPKDGPVYSGDGRYEDIVPGSRFLLAGSMTNGDQRISVSLMTLEVLAEGKGTRLIITEQAAFLDGADATDSRKKGWSQILDKLQAELAR